MMMLSAAVLLSSFLVYHGVQYILRKNPKLRSRSIAKVAIINLHGVIGVGNTDPFGLGNKNICFESVKKEVDAILEQEGVQELILNVNSPGGTPVQTERISAYITEKAEAHGIPVVAFIEDVAASGITIIKCGNNFLYCNDCEG